MRRHSRPTRPSPHSSISKAQVADSRYSIILEAPLAHAAFDPAQQCRTLQYGSYLTMRTWLRHSFLIAMFAGLSACTNLSSMPVGNRNVPEPAKAVELERYLGRWYELYRYDAPFQRNCESVAADYSRNADGSFKVLNSCRKGAVDGPVKSAKGRAKIVDFASQAKLKISFFGPFYGAYWVLDHDDDYQWSIVGEPSGRFLWVLARDPKPSENRKAMLRRRVQELGYDWALVRETRH